MLVALLTFCSVSAIFAPPRWGSVAVLRAGLGGGIQAGPAHGVSDAFDYQVVEDKVTVRDLQTFILHQLAFDAHAMSFQYQGFGKNFTGPTDQGQVVNGILA